MAPMTEMSDERECFCGGREFERVTVRRPDGSAYETQFVACVHCGVMYHYPHGAGPAMRASEIDDWAARYRKTVRREID
jgi:hypothetical protein